MKRASKLIIALLVVFSWILPYINPSKVEASSISYTYAYVDTDDLSTRTCPSFDCDRVNHDEGRVIWLYYPRVVEILGFEGNWAKVRYNYWGFTYEGYMYKDYLGGIKTVYLDTDYMNSLAAKGFPDSYIEKLAKMHAIHPNWNFEVSRVGTTLDEATIHEYYPLGKNLISTTNTTQLSTDPGAYNGNFIQFEPGWYAPSYQTLSYYLDARNFLDDNSIFMFEQLSYNSSQTEAIVQTILNGSFMSGSYNYNGQEITYARTFVDAGVQYGVSPVHLAARVMQEQGKGGSLTSDMESDGKIYHNYFNFDANGSTTEEIVARALACAKRNGWDNPHDAIFGGADGIADGYISNNQDTLFYQNFNLVGYWGKYENQYMANIQAPYSEAYSIYRSYFEAGIVNSNFTFKIPVYDGMGTGTYIATKSNNNNLSSLDVTNCSLNPAFNAAISVYNCTVDNSVSKVAIYAGVAHDKATVSGLGDKDLNVGTNEFKLTVTAEDGSTKDYNITITRKETNDSQTQQGAIIPDMMITWSGYKNNEGNVSGFTLGEGTQGVVDFIKAKDPNSSVKITDANYREVSNGTISTGQKIIVTAGNVTNVYNIVVYGDTNGDGKVSAQDFSRIKSHILKSSTLSGAYYSAADANKDNKVSAQDFSRVKSYILGKASLGQ